MGRLKHYLINFEHLKDVKQTFLLAIFVTLFFIPCLAQTNSQSHAFAPQTRKFDEFDFLDRDEEHIVRFAEALSKEPTAKAYIIVYEERVSGFCGEVSAGGAIWFLKNSLEGRQDYVVNPNRVVGIEGGLREKKTVELFIVPKGATPPVPTPTFEPNKAIRCPCLGRVISPLFVFENTNSPLTFYAIGKIDNSQIKPVYKWSVSEGRIISGQGTLSITVERPNSNYKAITATLEIGGFSSECNLKSSATSPEKLSSLPLKIDEFGKITCEDELARLDSTI